MRNWFVYILIGITGQLAWMIENMYFNVYLYNTITTDPGAIAAMVAASAITAALTTLIMGMLSDKLGKRKLFICFGYILWGFSTILFGYINIDNVQKLFPLSNAVSLSALFIILADCLMTFFGSTANDAAFNAYVTDTTTTDTRGKIESVLAILPLLSMLIIFGLFDGMTQRGEWKSFFYIFGTLVIAAGILSFFLIREPKIDKDPNARFSDLLYGFRLSSVKQNPLLYLTLTAFCVFASAVQVYFPYLIIYMQNYLKIDAYAIVLGIVLIVASIFSVVMGRFIDRIGKMKLIIPALVMMFTGLILMSQARTMATVMIFGSIMMSGYMLVTAILSATIRDYTPTDKVGLFQGIRIIFVVMIPMIIGPAIGAQLIQGNGETYVELGQVKTVPTPAIFLGAAILLVFTLIPLFFLRRRMNNPDAEIQD